MTKFFKSSGMFTLKTEDGRGRCAMLTSAVVVYANAWLTTGIFYTSFLMIYGINLVNIGILTFVPFIAGCFGIFSPSLLERFAKRRWLLAGGRFLHYTLNILGITLLPVFVHDHSARILAFVIIIFFASLIGSFVNSGYSVWHLNFIPERTRADFFLKQSMVSCFIGNGLMIISSIAADSLANSAYKDVIIIGLRYLAYFFGLIDVIILSLPKEYPYEKSGDKPRLRDIFVLPFSSKPFLFTMIMVFMKNFFMYVPSSFIHYYLINDVGIKYTLIFVVNICYPITLILLRKTTTRQIQRRGWFLVFAIYMALHAPTSIAYAFITAANYLWLFTVVRLAQHAVGVGANICFLNMAYVNLPETDRTNYISFYLLVVNISSCLGIMFGTVFVALVGDWTLTFLGTRFTSVQMLLFVEAFGQFIVPLFVWVFFKTLDPEARAKRLVERGTV